MAGCFWVLPFQASWAEPYRAGTRQQGSRTYAWHMPLMPLPSSRPLARACFPLLAVMADPQVVAQPVGH